MTIRMTGMMSNLDTDSIIKEMMSAQSLKKTKIENKKTKLEWTMDKWKGLNSKIYGLYIGSLNKVKTVGNYAAKKATSSNEALITGTISGINASKASTGSHTISVSELASGQFITGNKTQSNITNSTKLTEIGGVNNDGTGKGFGKGETIKVTVGTGSDAVEKSLTVGDSTTVKDFVSFLQSSGLNADFDEGQQRFTISSKESGKDKAFSIISINEDAAVATAKGNVISALGKENESVANDFFNNYDKANKELNDKQDYYDSLPNSASNEDKIKAYDELLAAKQRIKDLEDNLIKYKKEQSEANYKQKAEDSVADKYTQDLKDGAPALQTERATIVSAVEKMYYDYDSSGNKKFSSDTMDAAKASLYSKLRQKAIDDINAGILDGTNKYDDEDSKQLAIEKKYKDLIATEVTTTNLNTEAENMFKDSLNSAFASAGQNYVNTTAGQAEVTTEFNNYSGTIQNEIAHLEKYVRSTKQDGSVNTDSYKYAIDNPPVGGTISYTDSLSKLGIANIEVDAKGSLVTGITPDNDTHIGDLTYVAATDAKLTFDGAAYTSSQNNITIGGVTIDIKGITTAPVTLNVTNNTENSYEMIKDFVKNYNEVLTEMCNGYYAKSAKGYEPLTSEQKKAMSDDEIDKWEKKIQDSLLRRDDTLGGLMNTMRTALQASVTVDGKKYSLASLGITTSNDWTERGLLHIQGDSDDTYLPSKTNKLQKMLEQDPELVGKIISGVTNNLYETLQKKMSTSTLSSALTFYNDKQMTKQVDDYKDQIKTWEEKLQDMEDRYYKQFTAMEKALAKLNSQSSALSGLMGS